LGTFANELGERVIAKYPPLYQPGEPLPPELAHLRRRPFPAQTFAVLGVCRRLGESRSAAVIAECGTGKTLVALASIFAHARGKPFTAIFMVPPQLVEKTCRECALTLPGVRIFIIDGLRNGVSSNGYTGVNEVRFRNGRIIREGLKTSLSDMRLAKGYRSARTGDTSTVSPRVDRTSTLIQVCQSLRLKTNCGAAIFAKRSTLK